MAFCPRYRNSFKVTFGASKEHLEATDVDPAGKNSLHITVKGTCGGTGSIDDAFDLPLLCEYSDINIIEKMQYR
nr:hypothetical protein CFP56_56028 [Quercus suber]